MAAREPELSLEGARLKQGLLLVLDGLTGFVAVTGLGFLLHQQVTPWAGLLQFAYVIPLVLVAKHRSNVGLGVGAVCAAGVVLALNALAAALLWWIAEVG